MAVEIEPLRPEDLGELGRFLAEGFGAGADAEFASLDVLRWKYLEPIGEDDGPRSFVARAEGRIVGHVGLDPSAFVVATEPGRAISTLHMMDWLGSPGHRSVGSSLMRRAHARAQTQYGLGGSVAGREVARRAGYALIGGVPVFRKTLRLGSRLREPGSPALRAARLARDLARAAAAAGSARAGGVELRPVERFGAEVDEVVGRWPSRMVHTGRRPEALNHLLGHPRGGPTGWLVEAGGATRGFALLNVLDRGRMRVGRVAELFLDAPEAGLWRSALAAVAAELGRRGADVAEAVGGTSWEADALRGSGFAHAHDLDFHLRDREGLVPRDAPFHLAFFEADYAYT